MAEQGNTHAGHSRDIDQTPLDSNQHGQAQNLINETKSNFASQAQDKDIGSHRPEEGASGARLTDRVDDLLAGSGVSSGPNSGPAAKKASRIDDQGLKVGAEGDAHDLAASKQP